MKTRSRNTSVLGMLLVIAVVAAAFGISKACSGVKSDSGSTAIKDGGNFTAYYVDVGQGDCEVIVCDGEAMIIDGGVADESDKVYSFLKDKGISELKYVVCTHPHADHVGGLSGALKKCKADNVFCSYTSFDTSAFKHFVKYTEEQGKKVEVPKVGDEWSLGSAKITVFGPQKEYEDVNNNSIVLKFVYGTTKFLFTGDAGSDSEHDMIDAGCDLAADVLKVGHHGSSTATSYNFLREVMPKYAVIEVGNGNSYNHPHEETLSKLNDEGAQIFRTDKNGTVTIRSDGTNITTETEKNKN